MTAFDPNFFAQQTFVGENSTESVPFPEGDWPFLIEEAKVTAWQGKADPSKGGLKLQVKMSCEDQAVAKVTGRAKNTLTYECMLDLTEDGRLDMGKGMNVRLGRLRAAIGLNEPGTPWTFDMMAGRTCMGKVKHEAYEGRALAKIADVAKG